MTETGKFHLIRGIESGCKLMYLLVRFAKNGRFTYMCIIGEKALITFNLLDARYRHALQNWHAFVDAVQPELQRGDWSLPELPAKDLTQRIYRDVRFSNDKVRSKLAEVLTLTYNE